MLGFKVRRRKTPLGHLPDARLGIKAARAGLVLIPEDLADELGQVAPQERSDYLVQVAAFPGSKWAARVQGALPPRVRASSIVASLEARVARSEGSPQDKPLEELLPASPYIAMPARVTRQRDYLSVTNYDADVLPLDNLLVVSEDTTVTMGWLSSQAFWVWTQVVTEHEPGASTFRAYTTFPAPLLSRKERQRLEIAVDTILRARMHALGNDIEELYREMPRALYAAHNELDRVVNELLGLPADVSDERLAQHLVDRFVELLAA